MEGIQDAFYRPSIPQGNEIEKLYDTAMKDLFIRGKDVKTTLDDTVRKMDALLGSSWRGALSDCLP